MLASQVAAKWNDIWLRMPTVMRLSTFSFYYVSPSAVTMRMYWIYHTIVMQHMAHSINVKNLNR